jgi:CubicO group peptidase (beta-lactamase class C family)
MGFPPHAYEALERAVAAGVVPGAAAAVASRDGSRHVAVTGVRREGGPAVTTDTRYDLASLTKVIATLPSVLRLVADGALALDHRLEPYFSNAGWYQTPSLADVTVRALLSHTSGLPAWRPLFAQAGTRRAALAAVLQAPLERPGVVSYSDIGFMLLGALVERVSKRPLDAFARDEVFVPLGMLETTFGPIAGVPVAATEDCGWRNRLLEGEVHDENAALWDGVAGHAGLFGTVADVAAYASAWLRLDGRLGPEPLLREALALHGEGDDGARRGLGWLLAHPSAFAGEAARGYGHTGFTGTSLWIDPERGSASVLLTNRIHPHRARGDGIAALRSTFHGLAHAVPA